MIRILQDGDQAPLEAFLRGHAASSVFLRSNAAEAGLVDEGKLYQATYAAAFVEDHIVGVAAQCWNGMLLLQAPVHLDALAREAVARSGRPVRGFLGPWEQVVQARQATGHEDTRASCDSPEDLFELALQDLVLPLPITEGSVVVRRVLPADIDSFVAMQAAYEVEALGASPGPELEARERAEAERAVAAGTAFIAHEDGRPVASAGFNARLVDCVQVGGVFTPPALRGRGYGRAVVGGMLALVRGEGMPLAVLFTGRDNEPARRAYLALGFRIIGDYGIVMLEPPALTSLQPERPE